MSAPTANTLADFPPESFTLLAFCDRCGHNAPLDRTKIPPNLGVQQIAAHLRCTACGAGEGSIRIVYTGAGGFAHGAGRR